MILQRDGLGHPCIKYSCCYPHTRPLSNHSEWRSLLSPRVRPVSPTCMPFHPENCYALGLTFSMVFYKLLTHFPLFSNEKAEAQRVWGITRPT